MLVGDISENSEKVKESLDRKEVECFLQCMFVPCESSNHRQVLQACILVPMNIVDVESAGSLYQIGSEEKVIAVNWKHVA